MTDNLISEELRSFILRFIGSIAELEALLLLRAHPDERWTVEALAKRLYVSDPVASAALDHLLAGGLVRRAGETFVLIDQSDEKRKTIEELAAAYSRHLIPVTNLIHAKPRGLREFAAAFKFKKDRP